MWKASPLPGERVLRDGAFSSRRGTVEGLVPLRERIVPLMLPFITGLPLTIAQLPADAPALLPAAAECPSRAADLLRPFSNDLGADDGIDLLLRARTVHQSSNPSSVPFRLLKPPEQDTLSPR